MIQAIKNLYSIWIKGLKTVFTTYNFQFVGIMFAIIFGTGIFDGTFYFLIHKGTSITKTLNYGGQNSVFTFMSILLIILIWLSCAAIRFLKRKIWSGAIVIFMMFLGALFAFFMCIDILDYLFKTF
jgi:hypothetical protein